jgi:dipeptidyl aminopeptidase/acylaminoacyl peptidase
MLPGLDERELHVTTFAETAGEGFIARRLIFRDPLVGELEALALDPIAPLPPKRVPAIIGLHGHFDTPKVFADAYLGAELAASGYFVLIPQLRAMNCFGPEAEISFALLKSGFTLMGMRVYETLLMLKYLRFLDRVDATRIGILSHSGGSSTANLAVQLTSGLAAQVTDYFVDWRDHCTEFSFASVHCETLPAMFPLGPSLQDERYLDLPRLGVEYAFESPNTRARIRSFFAENLHPGR